MQKSFRGLTGEIANYVAKTRYRDIPLEVIRLAQGFVLDGLGVALAASMASGLRENFGTMTKPLHAGRAAENGVTAALLAEAGHTAALNILEARRGFFKAMAGGYDESKISGRLGKPYFMQEPGISIKPYPSGSLSHPAQDLILDLVKATTCAPRTLKPLRWARIPTSLTP